MKYLYTAGETITLHIYILIFSWKDRFDVPHSIRSDGTVLFLSCYVTVFTFTVSFIEQNVFFYRSE